MEQLTVKNLLNLIFLDTVKDDRWQGWWVMLLTFGDGVWLIRSQEDDRKYWVDSSERPMEFEMIGTLRNDLVDRVGA